MKRQSIMETYKEIKAAYSNDGYQTLKENKSYWVGIDSCGVLVATMDIHDIKGLTNVWPVEATSSDQAKVRYNVIVAEDAAGQVYAESIHP
jgi:hypothetical protein